jgi:hypothetical protein
MVGVRAARAARASDGRGPVHHRPLDLRARSSAVAFAAALTGAVAVGADVLAGERPAHVAALGLVALVVGIARLRSGGGRSALFAALSAALVAQPAVHAATALLPPAALGPGGPARIAPLVPAAAVVLAVAAAERLYLLAAGAGAFGRRLVALLRAPAVAHPAPRPRPASTAARTRLRPTSVALRRGPPVPAAA